MISWTAAFRSSQLALGVIVVLGYFGVLGYMLYIDAPGKDILIGGLASGFGLVVGYFYGSSNSSERKTELLARAPAVKE